LRDISLAWFEGEARERTLVLPEGFLPEKEWKMILRAMPIPCVDIVVEKDAKVLMGFRTIRPYRNVWALPGGRIRKHEYPQNAVERNLDEIGVSAEVERFIGVFLVKFPRDPYKRYDITLCYRCEWRSGEPTITSELRRFDWFLPASLPKPTGTNYTRMIQAALQENSPAAIRGGKV
jgi:ADP-ribose pyrophosphatase YjhB (NUDIX family)